MQQPICSLSLPLIYFPSLLSRVHRDTVFFWGQLLCMCVLHSNSGCNFHFFLFISPSILKFQVAQWLTGLMRGERWGLWISPNTAEYFLPLLENEIDQTMLWKRKCISWSFSKLEWISSFCCTYRTCGCLPAAPFSLRLYSFQWAGLPTLNK